jgi:hypothetical protein
MTGFWKLNLIHFFDFYLLIMFLAGTVRRMGQYHAIGALVLKGSGRWPRLLKLVTEHRMIFLTWSTVLPALLALGLSLAQLVASRWVWHEAEITIGEVAQHWFAAGILALLGLAMFAIDLYGVVVVGELDRKEMEKYFDQAEYWLRSRTAHVVRVFTFGFVNPRKMVAEEVRKALIECSRMLNTTLWWSSVQIGVRMVFGLTLWLTWGIAKA